MKKVQLASLNHRGYRIFLPNLQNQFFKPHSTFKTRSFCTLSGFLSDFADVRPRQRGKLD